MFFLLGILLIPLFLVIGLPLFIQGVLKPTAMIDNAVISSTNGFVDTTPQPTTPPDGSTPPQTPGPQPTGAPITPGDSRLWPSGFPVISSYVVQGPGGYFSHRLLNGIDIVLTNRKDPNQWIIRATHPGTVILAGTYDNYGQIVILESLDKSFTTFYGHMRVGSFKVRVGERVERNQQLGIVDNTGLSTADHIHYEIRGPKNPSNPWGVKTGKFGEKCTILNFLPACSEWYFKSHCRCIR